MKFKKITSRDSAMSNGTKFYYTGKPCKAGHIDERYVSTNHCKKCWDLIDNELTDKLAERNKVLMEAIQPVLDAVEKERQDILSHDPLTDDDLVRLAQIEELIEAFGYD